MASFHGVAELVTIDQLGAMAVQTALSGHEAPGQVEPGTPGAFRLHRGSMARNGGCVTVLFTPWETGKLTGPEESISTRQNDWLQVEHTERRAS